MERLLHTADLRGFAQGERLALFFFAIFPGNHTAACLGDYVAAIQGRSIPAQAVRELVRNLEAVHVLEEGIAARGVQGLAYRLSAMFSWKALRMLASEATRRGWWPTPEIASRGLAGAWLGAELAYGVRNFIEPLHVWQVAETMRAILVGGECAAFGLPRGVGYPLSSVHWTAVARLLELVAPQEVVTAEDLSPLATDRLLGVLLELCFLGGRDIRSLLEGARRLLAVSGVHLSASLLCAFCALCVWTGRRDLLAGAAAVIPRGSPAEAFAGLCLDVFEGRFAEAEKVFASGAAGFRSVFPEDVSTPVWTLGIALGLRVDAALTRVARCARELQVEPKTLLQWHPTGRNAVRSAMHDRTALVEQLMCSGAESYKPRPIPRSVQDPLQAPKNLFLAGYSTLAAVYAAERLRTDPGLPHLDEFCELLAKSGAVPLMKGIVREPKWRTALRALNDCLPARGAAARTEQALTGEIGWFFALADLPRGEDTLSVCVRLVPTYRGPRGAEDGQDDRRLTLKGLASARYRACLTSCDTEVLQVLLKSGYNPRVPYTVPDEAVALLCGHPRLMESQGESSLEDGTPRRAMTLERRPCEVTTEKGVQGEMILSLPGWMSKLPQTTYALRREEDGRYLFHPLPKKVRDVVAIMEETGEAGRLVLPTEALGEAKDVLERLAGVMSVGGAFSVGDGGAFKKVDGDPCPHVRLVYANDALSLSMVVEPLPNRAVAACEPGIGLRERLVQLRGGKTILLSRDLAAEESAAEHVRTALAAFDAWATGRNRWLVTSAEAALDMLRTVKGVEGVRLDWPEGEKIKVTAPSVGGVKIEASGTDWFTVDGSVTFDDGRVVVLQDLLRALENREGNYVRFGESDYLYLSGELLRRMEALANVVTSYGGTTGKTVRNQVSPAALPLLARAFEDGDQESLPSLPSVLLERAESVRKAFAEKVEVPRRFRGTLRTYQETGYAWLEHLASCRFGACLADDMGLGKTVQVIALLLKRAAEGVSLVVAPASVCVNWVREFEHFAPTLRPVTLWSEKKLPEGLGAGDVVVASYGLLVSRADEFASVDWNGVVLDEAQAVKNASTQRAHVAHRLPARFRVAATGTPVENRLAEFWSIFSFLNPGLLGTQREFEERFTEAGFATKALKRLVEPFVLRRLKRDVLKELPEKTEVTLRVALSEEERSAYEACRRNALDGLKARGETENRISILAALTRLRRFCCHPSLVLPEMSVSAKLDAVLNLLEDLREGGHRALVFSQFVDYLAIVRSAIEARGWTCRYLDGNTAHSDRVAAVDAFQRGDGDFFLISLKAGGTGLNLTAANYVLLLDPWWNPAVEDQAADRAHRIGQRLPVTVYRIVAEGTVEDRILDMHGDKRAVSEDLLESAKGVALTSERLLSLFDDGTH